MHDMKRLAGLIKELEEQLVVCMRCGMCQAVCPLFAETGREADVARGKIALLDGLAVDDGHFYPGPGDHQSGKVKVGPVSGQLGEDGVLEIPGRIGGELGPGVRRRSVEAGGCRGAGRARGLRRVSRSRGCAVRQGSGSGGVCLESACRIRRRRRGPANKERAEKQRA